MNVVPDRSDKSDKLVSICSTFRSSCPVEVVVLPTPDYAKVKNRWLQIPNDCTEATLESRLVEPLLESVGLSSHQIVIKNIPGGGGTPDRLLYSDPNKPPVMVMENKRRVPALATCTDQNFEFNVLNYSLYIHATEGEKNGVGMITQRGVKQYLDVNTVPAVNLASFGMVFNGDFLQFWRRVDGLVLPLSPIQRMTEETIPSLMNQLQYLLKSPHRALVTAIWNRKGGVSKTTNTINLGAELAIQGKRVLLIDADEQNDLTQGVGLLPEKLDDWFSDCVNLLQKGDLDAAKALVTKAFCLRTFSTSTTSNAGTYSLHVLSIPDKDIKGFREGRDISISTKYQIFRKLINLVAGEFDYIFIDTSPAYEVLTQCILMSTDTVLIPVDYGRKSLHHGAEIYKFLKDVREKRVSQDKLYWGPWNLGLLFSNCPPDAGAILNGLIDKELATNNFNGRVCQTRIRTFAQTKIAEFKHTPVVCWRQSPVTTLYSKLADELFLKHNFINE